MSTDRSTQPNAKTNQVHRGEDPDPTAKLNLTPTEAAKALKGEGAVAFLPLWLIFVLIAAGAPVMMYLINHAFDN